MDTLSPNDLRERFLRFFEQHQHRVVASSPVVPEGDPTLLFTNAGMNQFKDVLLGREKRDYVRAASVQKCVRAGGKHNDLDEVGRDGRHLTFFEMLGNWSFGDYYKRESIVWAWDFATNVIGLEADRLRASVYKTDDESYAYWRDVVGLDESRIVRLGDIDAGDEENFWSMGPTGPCGPCTEIYYDHHPELGDAPWVPGFDEERFVEIWNLVFMEYNRDETGELTPLPMQSVDTGMGLDRVAAILARVDNVFHTDLFWPILRATADALGGEYAALDRPGIYAHPEFIGFCVIADHVRTVTFSVCDGAQFSNEGRGYVLRRILRRAVRHGRNLGFDGPFLHDVARAVIESFQHVYPELRLKGAEARTIIKNEEARFFRTLDRGIALFEQVAFETREAGRTSIDGASVFKLYDTFGFPPDLTEIMAQEHGLHIDEHGYQAAMQAQRERSRNADERYVDSGEWITLQEGAADSFVGYDRAEHVSDVLRFRRDDGGTVEILLRETPFYAESGGQVGDTGEIVSAGGELVLRVKDTRRTTAGITHFADVVSGELASAALRHPVTARVDTRRRFLVSCNHTATHLLHAALHRFVNEHAFQAGSLVSDDRLRFDFSMDEPVGRERLAQIEAWVNEQIRANHPVKIHLNVALSEAESMGAMMIFEEKYGDHVRVVEVPGTSTELCGGIHVAETNDIAFFRILAETGVAAGVRRIEAVTNERAFDMARDERDRLERVSATLKTTPRELEERVERLLAERAELEKALSRLAAIQARVAADELADAALDIEGVRVAFGAVDVADRDALLVVADRVRERLGDSGAALVATTLDGKPTLLVLVTDGAVSGRGLKAGDLINRVAEHVGGRGGGRPTLAQAGGSRVEGIPDAVAAFSDAVRSALGA